MFSTFQCDPQDVAEDKTGQSYRNSTDTKLADPKLVPICHENVNQPSTSVRQENCSITAARASQRNTPTTRQNGTNGLSLVRQSLALQGISGQTQDILMGAWRKSTTTQYAPYLKKWETYCVERQIDPINPDMAQVLDFLTSLFSTGVGYSAINTAKCALGTIVTLADGRPMLHHPLLKRYMKGIFEQRPSLPRYSATWDVGQVLEVLKSIPPTSLGLKELSQRLALLLAMVTGQRLQTLVALNTADMTKSPTGYVFYIKKLLKTSKPGAHLAPIRLESYSTKDVCVVHHIELYIAKTTPLKPEAENSLFISYRKPYKAVGEETLSRWIKSALQAAGVDTATFSAHSTRGAATSAALKHGAPLDVILKAANWKSAKTFEKFYKRDTIDTQPDFASTVLQSCH